MNENQEDRSLPFGSGKLPEDSAGKRARKPSGTKARRSCEERLAEVEQRRNQLIATTVHDFRGPLTSLLGFSQLVERALAQGKPCDPRHIQVISREARRLNQMVDDLADLSLIEMGKLEMEREPTDIVALAQKAIERIPPTGGHPVPVLKAERRPLAGNWDPNRLAQALGHLIEHAVRSSADGRQATVTLAPEDSGVRVTVAYQGPGIPPELLPLVFEPFSPFHRERRTKSLGIGLFLAKGIIDAHGGNIRVQSEAGKEDRFVFVLPW
ncbi:MAG: HAMP domain-containing histidine kinase [Chloroflexi bacterium]|nr:HAMP domain-containing histidine kinase [Chloroflexota bacterium]